MADFSKQINDFESSGVYTYKFDQVGNQILNPSSSTFQENYVAFSLNNIYYNNDKILLFYNPSFEEFTTSSITQSLSILPDNLQQQLDATALTNQLLTQQLTDLLESTEDSSLVADNMAIKDVIIQLRISLGEGIQISDFDDVFPYLPKPQ